jgi:death-on-curing protein
VIDYLDLADFLLKAEAALGIDAEALYMQADLPMAESALSAPRAAFGEVEFYESFPEKVAVLGQRIVANHPLLDGNKRTALLCMMEFTERNGYRWVPPAADEPDGDETVEVMVALAAGELSGERFLVWVTDRIKADVIE